MAAGSPSVSPTEAAIDALDEAELELSSRAKGSVLSRRSELSAAVPLALAHPVLVHAASQAPSVCYKTLRLFAGHLKNIPNNGSEPLTLFSLTRDATLHIPSNTASATSTSNTSNKMAELRAQLQDQADRQAYNRMVSSAPHGQPRLLSSKATTSTLVYSKQDQWEADDWQQTRRELSAMLNVLLTMLAVGFAAWWMLGNVKPAPKVLACMGAALFIGLAEAFLYIRFFQRKHAAANTSQLLPKTGRGSGSASSSSSTPVGIVRPPIRRTKSASSLPRYRPARTTSPLSGEARPISPNPGTYQRPVSRCSMPDQLRRCAIERHRLQQTYRLSRTASFPPLQPGISPASMSV